MVGVNDVSSHGDSDRPGSGSSSSSDPLISDVAVSVSEGSALAESLPSVSYSKVMFNAGFVLLALMVAGSRMFSAFGVRQAETLSIEDLFDKLPRTNLIHDDVASAWLAIIYCIITGSINALSEMFSILEFGGLLKGKAAAAVPAPVVDAAVSVDAASPSAIKRNKGCCYTPYLMVPRAAANALITGGMAFNGALFLVGGKNPDLRSHILASIPAAIIFSSSTFFNARKQIIRRNHPIDEAIKLEGYKQVLFPLMVVASLVTNTTTAIYQSLLVLKAFNASTQVAIPVSLTLALLSDWNLCYAQIPEVERFFAGKVGSKERTPHPFLASRLLAGFLVYTAAALTPFNTPQGLLDTLHLFTACYTDLSHQAPSDWYNSAIASPIIWAVGIILGINVAYSLLAFRGQDVDNLIARCNTGARDLLCASRCTGNDNDDASARPFAGRVFQRGYGTSVGLSLNADDSSDSGASDCSNLPVSPSVSPPVSP